MQPLAALRLLPVVALLLGAACSQASLPSGAQRSTWSAPAAKQQELLYAFSIEGSAFVFAYPQGGLVGEFAITGAKGVWGACSDTHGDVFVTVEESDTASYVYEYAHGGTSPIAKLRDDGYAAASCSSDPTTGDLAVTNNDDGASGRANVAIYRSARGEPQHYFDAKMSVAFGGYDDRGDLFVDGDSGTYRLAELPKGGRALQNIRMKNEIADPRGVQWDGSELAIESGGLLRTLWSIDRVDVSNGNAAIVGTTRLHGLANRGATFWIESSAIATTGGQAVNRVGLWRYPAGGKVVKIFYPRKTKDQTFYGVTVSRISAPR
jgi:hypothetical protein